MNDFLNKQPKNSTDARISDAYSAPQDLDNSSIRFETTDHDDGDWKSLTGRIGRIQFLAYNLFWVLVLIPLAIVLAIFGSGLIMAFALGGGIAGAGAGAIVGIIVILAMLVPFVYMIIILPRRRLQDLNQPPWWLVIPILAIFMPYVGLLSGIEILYLFPILNGIFQLCLVVIPGSKNINNYGLPPKPYTTIQMILAVIMMFFYALSIIGAIVSPNALDPSYMGEMEDEQSIDEMIAEMEAELEAQNAAGGEFESPEEGTVEWTDEEQARFDSIDDHLEQMQADMGSDDYWEEAQGGDANLESQQNSNVESDAQIQAAIDEAVGADSSSESGDMSLEEFLQSDHTVYVDKTPAE